MSGYLAEREAQLHLRCPLIGSSPVDPGWTGVENSKGVAVCPTVDATQTQEGQLIGWLGLNCRIRTSAPVPSSAETTTPTPTTNP